MNKIRINVLARELEVKAHELLDKLPELGVTEKKTHSSSIDDDVAEKLDKLRLRAGQQAFLLAIAKVAADAIASQKAPVTVGVEIPVAAFRSQFANAFRPGKAADKAKLKVTKIGRIEP